MNTSAESIIQLCKSLFETQVEGLQLPPADPEPSEAGCLLQICPPRPSAEIFRISTPRILIGRDPSCDFSLDDHLASRNHAAIETESGRCRVADLGSRNGTWVNDHRIHEPIRLVGGELLRFGGTTLKYLSHQNEEAAYHAVVHEMMTRDPLTGAYNRNYLIPSLERMMACCQRTGADLSLIIMDIDHFKRINDTHGHLIGDEVLKRFCERVRVVMRSGDFLARLGGEEFVVVVNTTQLCDAVRVAERIRLAVAAPEFQTAAGLIPVTCSLGVANVSNDSLMTVDQLLQSADECLYAAKHAGRNIVRFRPGAPRSPEDLVIPAANP